ncbi:unnamed protein product [Echinostoma caproni]|uniref:Metallophos domain-containing protein n=1 Tax=Echinostoma caproni TaxID=27848 RepID=A0A183AGE4_9TREM|nr:unnamed protein product [Echinostoma caproni]
MKKAGTFWHFTDIHLDSTYYIDDLFGVWGNYRRDSSLLVAATAIGNATDLDCILQQPDFVIWSGDNSPHNNTLTADDVLESLMRLSNWFTLFAVSKNISVLPVIGEYDLFPAAEISPLKGNLRREEWCHRLATESDYWSRWIQEAEESVKHEHGLPKALFNETGCYHSMLLPESIGPQILLIGLNSIIWYVNNPKLQLTEQDPLDQFRWLIDSLTWARENNAKAIIVTHLPPGTAELHPTSGQYMHPNYNDQLVSILREFSDVIITTLAGHEHVDGFRVLLDESYKPVGTVFNGPSVDPLVLPERGDFNPRIRLYHYDRETGTLLNYQQLWLNLSTSGPIWQLEYTARDEYSHLTDLSPQSMADLLDEFTKYNNPDNQWSNYWEHQLGYRPHVNKSTLFPGGTCPNVASVCRCEHVCAMRHLDAERWEKCISDYCMDSTNPRLPTIRELSVRQLNMTQLIVLVTVGALCLITFILITVVCIYRKKQHGAGGRSCSVKRNPHSLSFILTT